MSEVAPVLIPVLTEYDNLLSKPPFFFLFFLNQISHQYLYSFKIWNTFPWKK